MKRFICAGVSSVALAAGFWLTAPPASADPPPPPDLCARVPGAGGPNMRNCQDPNPKSDCDVPGMVGCDQACRYSGICIGR